MSQVNYVSKYSIISLRVRRPLLTEFLAREAGCASVYPSSFLRVPDPLLTTRTLQMGDDLLPDRLRASPVQHQGQRLRRYDLDRFPDPHSAL